MTDRYEKNLKALSHEIWAAAQLAPGEGIVDGVARIEAMLRAECDALLDALRQIAEWPDGGNRYGQENIKRFARHTIDAAHRKQGEQP